MSDRITVSSADGPHRVAYDLYQTLRHFVEDKPSNDEAVKAHLTLFLKCRQAVIAAEVS